MRDDKDSGTSKALGALRTDRKGGNTSKSLAALAIRETVLLASLRGLRLPTSRSLRSRDRPRLAALLGSALRADTGGAYVAGAGSTAERLASLVSRASALCAR